MRHAPRLAIALACGALCWTSCRSAAPVPEPGPAHLGEAWYAFRARQLGIEPAAARTRDADLSEQTPPHELWGPELSREARALWRDLCARCHGARGRLEGVPPLPPEQKAPRDWGGTGAKLGWWLGGDALRATTYRRIRRGGDREGHPSLMPAWGEVLSREQTWALVFLLEDF